MFLKTPASPIPSPVPGRQPTSCRRSSSMLSASTRRICLIAAVLASSIVLFRSTASDDATEWLSSALQKTRPSNVDSVIHSEPEPVGQIEDDPNVQSGLQPQSRPVVETSTKQSTPSHLFESSAKAPVPGSDEARAFWQAFTEVLARGSPSFAEVRRKGDNGEWIFFDRNKQPKERPDLLELSDDEFNELRTLRDGAVDDIKGLAGQMPYQPGTRGIVTTAPPNAFGILTTSLWVLRRTGSTLPVEIWLYDRSEYESEPCDDIFPSLNAKCMFMTDYLPEGLEHPLKIVKFTYKPLATIFSTFEQIIFLDDDVFPVMNPETLFESEPFKTNRMLLWPDFWADTASIDLYELSGLPVPSLTDQASTESGEIVVDKASHGAALLLAAWFNTYGPEYWHRLASQQSPGEGDKDLWKFAARAFDLSLYQIEESPQRVGYVCNGDTWPVGSAHSHPVDDWKIVNANMVRDKEKYVSLGTSTHPRILFIHSNLPKLDPYLLLDWERITPNWNHTLRCTSDGPVHRLYGPPDLTVPKYGWDVEEAIWEAFVWMTCVHEKAFSVWTTVSYWRPEPRNDLCQAVQGLWDEHFPGKDWSRTPPDPSAYKTDRPWGEHVWS